MRNAIGMTIAMLLGAAVLTSVATAKDRSVEVDGICTRGSTFELELESEHGRIEVEFEVVQRQRGVRWTVTLHQNGVLVGRRAAVTRGPKGKFETKFLARNRPGTDRFVARAIRGGERCVARAGFPY